ncbi:MAG TPA: MlaD family protein [Gemmatimonadaceae bacterium]|nr:MlaD family protein [Gemmatimonadaceae bacterium]
MKRSTFITWEQLKVGLLILFALGILTVAVFKLGQAANLFEKRYELVTFLPNANGLREGGSVTVAGQLAGIIKRIDFLPVDRDTTRNLKITVEINQALQQQIREDSRARVRTLGLLGDKVLDISVGTPRYSALPSGDTLLTTESLDYEQVLAQASGAVDDMVQLTADLRQITGGIVRGEGTMGQLLTNRTLYDQLNGTLTEMNGLLARLQKPNGTFGRLIDDPTLYDRLTSVTASLDSVLIALNSRQGTMGKLLADDTLYTRLVSITTGADSLLRKLHGGDGFAAKMLNDQEMYDKLTKTLTDLNAILEDVRRDPRKYTKGMIKVF